MDQIIIQDLEVFYRVGVPKRERAKPQRLLLTVQLEHDFGPAWWRWVQLLAGFAIVFVTAGIVLFEFAVEE